MGVLPAGTFAPVWSASGSGTWFDAQFLGSGATYTIGTVPANSHGGDPPLFVWTSAAKWQSGPPGVTILGYFLILTDGLGHTSSTTVLWQNLDTDSNGLHIPSVNPTPLYVPAPSGTSIDWTTNVTVQISEPGGFGTIAPTQMYIAGLAALFQVSTEIIEPVSPPTSLGVSTGNFDSSLIVGNTLQGNFVNTARQPFVVGAAAYWSSALSALSYATEPGWQDYASAEIGFPNVSGTAIFSIGYAYPVGHSYTLTNIPTIQGNTKRLGFVTALNHAQTSHASGWASVIG